MIRTQLGEALEKEPGFIPSPLSEPVPELDLSAPECPTLWRCSADTSALQGRKKRRKKIKDEKSQHRQAGSQGEAMRDGAKSDLSKFRNKPRLISVGSARGA